MANTNPQRLAGWASRWLTGELQALASVGNWEGAIQTFQQMSQVTKEEVVPGTQNYPSNKASSSSSSFPGPTPGAPTTSFAQEKQNANAKVFHYTTIISACAKADQWEAALRAFTHMHREAKCEPNIRTYTSVIHACTKGNRIDYALRAWAMMEADGIVANCFATTALVAAFAKAGKWQEAIATAVEAESNPFPNQEPNIFTYTAAMDACRRAGKAEPAVAIMKRMKNVRGVAGNTVSYTTALHACAVAKNWQCATEVLNQMSEEKIFIVPFARTCALEAFSEAPADVAEKGLDPWLGARKASISNKAPPVNTQKQNSGDTTSAKTVTVGGNSSKNVVEPESTDSLQDPPTEASYKEQKF